MRYETKKVTIPAGDGTRMKLLILIPTQDYDKKDRTGVLWIHGGGYVTGMAGMVYMSRAKALVKNYGAVVVSPEYRLAGQAPYPAALMDCHYALLYLREHTEELGVRSDQIMVGGESAGGGLAAALCMYEKDCGGVEIAFQMPLYPMLDNEDTETSRNNHAPVWNTKRNHYGWAKYLRGLPGGRSHATPLPPGGRTMPGCLPPIPLCAPPSPSMPRPSPMWNICGRPAWRRRRTSTRGCSTLSTCCSRF